MNDKQVQRTADINCWHKVMYVTDYFFSVAYFSKFYRVYFLFNNHGYRVRTKGHNIKFCCRNSQLLAELSWNLYANYTTPTPTRYNKFSNCFLPIRTVIFRATSIKWRQLYIPLVGIIIERSNPHNRTVYIYFWL